jgi:hypothetical protein
MCFLPVIFKNLRRDLSIQFIKKSDQHCIIILFVIYDYLVVFVGMFTLADKKVGSEWKNNKRITTRRGQGQSVAIIFERNKN